MHFDIISVFPEFFSVLDLSLVGKAREKGIITVACHDLRNWTEDVHRTVDDTPAGGGAGMVMRADIWGKAIDTALANTPAQSDAHRARVVLAIPTPSGEPLTQRTCESLAATASHIILACGRYEGIDARVGEYYASQGIEVLEYSLGDYVLNGGEVAAVALVEAVSRLLPGMVGNPDSLREESYSAAGLLEYPVYTRPVEWRGLKIPDVLLGGNHREAARWRRNQALERTAARRPDLIGALDTHTLDKKDRRTLTQCGFLATPATAHPSSMRIREAEINDAPALASFAARTFPDACPPGLSSEAIAAFITESLSESSFAAHLTDPNCLILMCERHSDNGWELAGYTLTFIPEGDGVSGEKKGAPVGLVLDGVPRHGPLVELSKFYVDREFRGLGLSNALWEATLAAVCERTHTWPEPYIWLGTNEGNRRARKAYQKLGFTEVGTRTFRVGDEDNSDVVFARRIRMA